MASLKRRARAGVRRFSEGASAHCEGERNSLAARASHNYATDVTMSANRNPYGFFDWLVFDKRT